MAIQVNGTTVIDNSRNLTNVGGLKTVGGSTLMGSGDIAVGEKTPAFNPSATPNATFTSSGTWYKPSLAAGAWVVIHMVGGGAGGNKSSWGCGGNGASAVVLGYKAATLPSSITFTVGAGGTNGAGEGPSNSGNNTSCTIDGRLYTAFGGLGNLSDSSNYQDSYGPSQTAGSYFVPNSGISPYAFDGSGAAGGTVAKLNSGDYNVQNSEFGGGAGAGHVFATSTIDRGTAGISKYAGNGGLVGRNGSAYGGGGGKISDQNAGGNGGTGGIKIWYIT